MNGLVLVIIGVVLIVAAVLLFVAAQIVLVRRQKQIEAAYRDDDGEGRL